LAWRRGHQLLAPELRAQLEEAKLRALRRKAIEAGLPEEMRFVKGWPTRVPTREEADMLARVRTAICELMGIQSDFLTPDALQHRYEQLIQERRVRAAKVAMPRTVSSTSSAR
jgi:hypothetical protein